MERRLNPYAPPRAEVSGAPLSKPRPQETLRLPWIVLCTFVGAAGFAFAFAHHFRGPGDPTGHSIAAGLGGLAGLGLSLTFRFARWLLQRDSRQSTILGGHNAPGP